MKRSFFGHTTLKVVAAAFLTIALSHAQTPPTLMFSSPEDDAVDVSAQSQISFLFSEAMAPTQSIQWSSNVNPSQFNYTWLGDGMFLVATYLPGLPAGQTITWTLNPVAGAVGNFRSAAGVELPAATFTGSFTVAGSGGGDPNDPCNGGQTSGGFGSVAKQVTYFQAGDAAPALDPQQRPTFAASFRGATNHNVTAVNVSGPAGNITLTNFFGTFSAIRQFDTVAALDAGFPAGNYTLNATGAGSATVALGNTGTMPVPRVNNLAALTAMDVTKDFTLNFAPFTGAGANDVLSVQITGDQGGNFLAPDPCLPRALANTATSVVIPANTFKAGEKLSGYVYFFRGIYDTNSIPNAPVSGGAGNMTRFEITLGGSTNGPTQPTWTTVTRNPDGTITYTIEGDAGVSVAIEGSETLTGAWTELTTGVLATGSFEFTVTPNTPTKRFYRARVL